MSVDDVEWIISILQRCQARSIGKHILSSVHQKRTTSSMLRARMEELQCVSRSCTPSYRSCNTSDLLCHRVNSNWMCSEPLPKLPASTSYHVLDPFNDLLAFGLGSKEDLVSSTRSRLQVFSCGFQWTAQISTQRLMVDPGETSENLDSRPQLSGG